MNNDKLNKKREDLVQRFNESVSRLEQVEKSIQKALAEKENIVAHANALKGAVEVIDQLIKEDEPVNLEVVR